MRKWLKTHPVDVINSHSSTDSWLVALACKTLSKSPLIVRTRHISSPIPDNLASRWIYARAPVHVVTTGESLRKSLLEQFNLKPERITSIPTGIDPERFQPGDKLAERAALGLDSRFNYLGIIATLRSWKGHSYLIDAFASLDAPDWRLLVVGDGPMRDTLSAQVHAKGIQDRVLMVGQKSDAERWMRALDVFCLPSYANEGVPQAIMQAMLTGLPIVTTPVGAILEVVTNLDTALVVQPKSSQALSDSLVKLMQDSALRVALGERARQRALSQSTLEIMLDRMERVFYGVHPHSGCYSANSL
jgi:glycosyltransferase involved in cell wall biosynthesis